MAEHPYLVVALTLLCSVLIIIIMVALSRSVARDFWTIGRALQGDRESFTSEQQQLQELSTLVQHIKQYENDPAEEQNDGTGGPA